MVQMEVCIYENKCYIIEHNICELYQMVVRGEGMVAMEGEAGCDYGSGGGDETACNSSGTKISANDAKGLLPWYNARLIQVAATDLYMHE